MLTYNAALENLYIEVDDTGVEFGKEMYGALPSKLNNITITGKALKYISQYLLSVSNSFIITLNFLYSFVNQECIFNTRKLLIQSE